jgi:hypothetical protein
MGQAKIRKANGNYPTQLKPTGMLSGGGWCLRFVAETV